MKSITLRRFEPRDEVEEEGVRIVIDVWNNDYVNFSDSSLLLFEGKLIIMKGGKKIVSVEVEEDIYLLTETYLDIKIRESLNKFAKVSVRYVLRELREETGTQWLHKSIIKKAKEIAKNIVIEGVENRITDEDEQEEFIFWHRYSMLKSCRTLYREIYDKSELEKSQEILESFSKLMTEVAAKAMFYIFMFKDGKMDECEMRSIMDEMRYEVYNVYKESVIDESVETMSTLIARCVFVISKIIERETTEKLFD